MINPASPTPTMAIKNTKNPNEIPRKVGAAVPLAIPLIAVRIENTTKATTPITATTGKNTLIKLAVNPNFLADSSDTLQSSNVIGCNLGISFSLA